MNGLPAALAACNVLFALFVFVLIARPERLLPLLAWWAGVWGEWSAGELDEDDEQKLISDVRRLHLLLLGLLFAVSFVCGATISVSRL